jgi:hypothetical protein
MSRSEAVGRLVLVLAFVDPAVAMAFKDAHELPPAGWTGPVFKLSQEYPATRPAAEERPWKAIDYKTKPAEYLKAVLDYCYDGNIEVDFRGQDNVKRKWYHTPWLDTGNKGREFIHGMTRERTTPARRLHPNQSSQFGAYAVGLYNPTGGYTIGQVWKDPENPDPSKAKFSEGTVACKLLFTQATAAQVPYLAGTVEWDAYAGDSFSSTTRTVKKVRLLQIDVAVKDSRAAGTTGWVFGTFNYNSAAPGTRPWDKMVPIGLMYGNDPTLKPQNYRNGARPKQSVIISANVMANAATDWKGLGWLERLNGPIDNPASACISCHMTAEWPRPSSTPMFLSTLRPADVNSTEPLDPEAVTQKMKWFRNIKGKPFDTGSLSLDYSLQLFDGIAAWNAAEGDSR